ncbi:hypothetical protein PANDA_020624, partial [Ailuropoda melanoleuca]
ISRGLREKLAEPGARAGRRRGGRIPTMGCLDPHGEDIRKTWRRLDAPKPKSSHSDNDLPEDYPVVKNMLHRLTVHCHLPSGSQCLLSVLLFRATFPILLTQLHAPPRPRSSRCTQQTLLVPAPHTRQALLCPLHCAPARPGPARSLSRSSSTEAAQRDRLSVAKPALLWAFPHLELRRLRSCGEASLVPSAAHRHGAGPPPRRIRVDLDWERGRVAFYDGRSLDLLFAFQAPGSLGERVFPLLCTRDARAPLRIVPAE